MGWLATSFAVVLMVDGLQLCFYASVSCCWSILSDRHSLLVCPFGFPAVLPLPHCVPTTASPRIVKQALARFELSVLCFHSLMNWDVVLP